MKELLDTFHTIPANWKVVEKDGFPLASGAYVVLRGLRDALFDFQIVSKLSRVREWL